MSLRSPTDSKSDINSNQPTQQKHRGYSILNMPVNVMADESDDQAIHNESSHHKPNSNETEMGPFGVGNSSKYPDLFFQGYGIEPL